MAWVKFDDSYWLNRKVRRAGRDAAQVHHVCIGYSNRNGTGGVITAQDLADIAHEAMLNAGQLRKFMAICVEHELLEVDGTDWVVHDYFDYQPSDEKTERDRERARERQRLKRERDKKRDSHAVTAPVTDGVSHTSPARPGPSRPVPDLPPPPDGSSTPGPTGDGGGGIDDVVNLIAERQLAKNRKPVTNVGGWLSQASKRVHTQYHQAIHDALAEGCTPTEIADHIEPAPKPYRGNPIDEVA